MSDNKVPKMEVIKNGKVKWKKTKDRKIISFTNDDGDEALHIIKTGFEDMYWVLREDAYETTMSTEILNKQKIEEKYNISNINLKIKCYE